MPERDEVQHDRADDLADAAGHLEHARRCRPTARRPRIGDDDDQQDVQRARAARPPHRPPAATIVASRYWPSTPMLNRPIRKATETASPARNSGTARLRITTIDWTCCAGVSPRSSHHLRSAASGFSPISGDDERGDDQRDDDRRGPARRAASPMRRSDAHAAPAAVVRAGHVATELLGGARSAGSRVATSRAAQHHVQRVGQADQLVEVGGDQQDPHPFGAGVLEQLPDRPPARRRRRRGSGGRRSAAAGRRSSRARR